MRPLFQLFLISDVVAYESFDCKSQFCLEFFKGLWVTLKDLLPFLSHFLLLQVYSASPIFGVEFETEEKVGLKYFLHQY